MRMRTASEIKLENPPRCPTCGEYMTEYGGSAGYIHCGWKMLYRAGGWFDDNGWHVKDDRLAGGNRRIYGKGIIHERP